MAPMFAVVAPAMLIPTLLGTRLYIGCLLYTSVVKLLESYPDVSVAVTKITGANGSTDFVRIVIPGAQGKRAGCLLYTSRA